jgi:DNA-binding Xre family transcriptional regulator
MSIRSRIDEGEKMDGMIHPGIAIAAMMRARGWTEGELSRRARVTQPTIHRIITGESKEPRRSNLERIARALGCSIDDLYDPRAALDSTSGLDERAARFAVMMADLSDEQIDLILQIASEFLKVR